MADGATATMDNQVCIICCVPGCEGRLLRKKEFSTLLVSSKKRGDKLHEKMTNPDEHFVHEKCYREYTSAYNISKVLESEMKFPDKHILRSEKSPFEYNNNCLICAEKLDFGAPKRHTGRHSVISSIETMGKDICIMQQTLLNACDKRQDDVALDVKARILYAGDIRAVEAKYHRTCMQRFLKGIHIKSEEGILINQRNLNTTKGDAFIQLCRWLLLDAQSETQYNMQDLQDQLDTYLPTEVAPYSAKHLKRRLIEYFGEHISIAEIDGKANIVTLRAKATTIMHDSYYDIASNEYDDGIEMAKQLGSVIRNELSQLEQPLDIYPTPGDVDVDKLADEPALSKIHHQD